MSDSQPTSPLSRTKLKAALLVAIDRLSDEKIAEECGISRRTLATWKSLPEFQLKVQDHVEHWHTELLRVGLGDKRRRIARLAERHRKLELLAEERAADPEIAKIPGGKSGFIVRRLKIVRGADGTSKAVPEYVVDAPLLSELRAIEEQIAVEVGDWKNKHEVTGKDGKPIDFAPLIIQLDPLDQKA